VAPGKGFYELQKLLVAGQVLSCRLLAGHGCQLFVDDADAQVGLGGELEVNGGVAHMEDGGDVGITEGVEAPCSDELVGEVDDLVARCVHFCKGTYLLVSRKICLGLREGLQLSAVHCEKPDPGLGFAGPGHAQKFLFRRLNILFCSFFGYLTNPVVPCAAFYK